MHSSPHSSSIPCGSSSLTDDSPLLPHLVNPAPSLPAFASDPRNSHKAFSCSLLFFIPNLPISRKFLLCIFTPGRKPLHPTTLELPLLPSDKTLSLRQSKLHIMPHKINLLRLSLLMSSPPIPSSLCFGEPDVNGLRCSSASHMPRPSLMPPSSPPLTLRQAYPYLGRELTPAPLLSSSPHPTIKNDASPKPVVDVTPTSSNSTSYSLSSELSPSRRSNSFSGQPATRQQLPYYY